MQRRRPQTRSAGQCPRPHLVSLPTRIPARRLAPRAATPGPSGRHSPVPTAISTFKSGSILNAMLLDVYPTASVKYEARASWCDYKKAEDVQGVDGLGMGKLPDRSKRRRGGQWKGRSRGGRQEGASPRPASSTSVLNV